MLMANKGTNLLKYSSTSTEETAELLTKNFCVLHIQSNTTIFHLVVN